MSGRETFSSERKVMGSCCVGGFLSVLVCEEDAALREERRGLVDGESVVCWEGVGVVVGEGERRGVMVARVGVWRMNVR